MEEREVIEFRSKIMHLFCLFVYQKKIVTGIV